MTTVSGAFVVPSRRFVPLPVPGGVASADRQSLFVGDRGGGIVALSIDRGLPRWTTKRADLPLCATYSTLLSARSSSGTEPLVVSLINVETGAERFHTPNLCSPPQSWQVQAVAGADREFTLWWEEFASFGGAPLPDDAPPAPVAHAHHVEPGKVRPINESMPQDSGVMIPTGIGPDVGRDLLIWTVNGTSLSLRVEKAASEHSRLLLISGTSRLTLFDPAPPAGHVDCYVTDGGARLLLLVTETAGDGSATAGTSLTWYIFSAPNGAKLGQLPFDPNSEPTAAVLGSRFLYRTTDSVLHCLSLPSGAELWRRPVAGSAAIQRRG